LLALVFTPDSGCIFIKLLVHCQEENGNFIKNLTTNLFSYNGKPLKRKQKTKKGNLQLVELLKKGGGMA
jgi:hypothetical protein